MRLFTLILTFNVALAARPFLNEPDTGLQTYLGDATPAEASGTLLPLEDMITIPDFEFAARAYMSSDNYSYYRTGAAGEYSEYLPLGSCGEFSDM
jgi:hypothetical protein